MPQWHAFLFPHNTICDAHNQAKYTKSNHKEWMWTIILWPELAPMRWNTNQLLVILSMTLPVFILKVLVQTIVHTGRFSIHTDSITLNIGSNIIHLNFSCWVSIYIACYSMNINSNSFRNGSPSMNTDSVFQMVLEKFEPVYKTIIYSSTPVHMLVPVLMMSLAYLAWQYYYWHVFQDQDYQFE